MTALRPQLDLLLVDQLQYIQGEIYEGDKRGQENLMHDLEQRYNEFDGLRQYIGREPITLDDSLFELAENYARILDGLTNYTPLIIRN